MSIMNLSSIEDTRLWQQLMRGFKGADSKVATTIGRNLIAICNDAGARMKAFPSLHPQFTLHDETHLLRVTQLMGMVIPEKVLKSVLNPVEVSLLILSAFFHDQGMVLDAEELKQLRSRRDFITFQETWGVEHPNIHELREYSSHAVASGIQRGRIDTAQQELSAAVLTDFVRMTHGERSAFYIRERHGNDKRLEIAGVNLSEFVARLALSHVEAPSELSPGRGFRLDEAVGQYRINMIYLGLVLRVADILDFDRERTPDSLYRTIDFTSGISLREWEKHRSVEGWNIGPSIVRFTLRCERPEYQRAAYEFMDSIDRELSAADSMVKLFPKEFAHYAWDIPSKVDRSRIEAKNNSYIYRDLEFSLSRDEIVKLLMTRELYGGPWLCVRELLQNSLDALRFRVAVHKRDLDVSWDEGQIHFSHFHDADGREILRCEDNGIGMDVSIIERFLTNVGRSYYRSPEFEQERIALRAANADFDPCSRFGIGFMSVFMLGDRIRIETRRTYGSHRALGDPLVVEVNGLGGMIIIRPGNPLQKPGTAVEIVLRPTKAPRNKFSDDVRLIAVLKGYALATEFPISGNCSIKGLVGSVEIPPIPEIPATVFETEGVKNLLTLSQQYSEIDPSLGGQIRSSFLVDDARQLALKSSNAQWEKPLPGDSNGIPAILFSGKKITHQFWKDGQTAIDGILVAGDPGRKMHERSRLGSYANPIHSGGAAFLLDIRGPLKPPLTAARTRPSTALGPDIAGKWARIADLGSRAEGRLWEEILTQCSIQGDPLLFWQLATIYRAPVLSMRKKVIWEHLMLPFAKDSDDFQWRHIQSLGIIKIQAGLSPGNFQLLIGDGNSVQAPREITQWESGNRGESVNRGLKGMLILMSTFELINGEIVLIPNTETGNFVVNENTLKSMFAPPTVLKYGEDLHKFVSACSPVKTVNRTHPLVSSALDARFLEEANDVQKFAEAMMWQVSDPEIVAVIDGTKEPGLRHQYAGQLFKSVAWNENNRESHPPYLIRSGSGKTVEITEEILSRWADAQVPLPDDFD
jgi:hypothetical protein